MRELTILKKLEKDNPAWESILETRLQDEDETLDRILESLQQQELPFFERPEPRHMDLSLPITKEHLKDCTVDYVDHPPAKEVPTEPIGVFQINEHKVAK